MKRSIITQKYKWTTRGYIRCTGFAWCDGKLISEDKFGEEIEHNSHDFENFAQWICSLNGPFAIIKELEEEIWMATSHTWTYPLFYAQNSVGLEIGDTPESFNIPGETQIRTEDELYFLAFGVTPGNHTLNDQIKSVMPGEAIRLKGLEIQTVNKLDSWLQTELPESTAEDTAQRIRAMFQRYSGIIGKRKVLLPLTSGYDSRLLACLLKEFGHSDVICATWGNPENIEREAAQKVAERLGYPYLFIPYNHEVIANFPTDPEFGKFVRHVGHLSSMPYLQEYFAIRQLIKEGVIDQNTVVIPGHPGDFLRGSHLTPGLTSEENSRVIKKILAQFGSDYPLTGQEKMMVINETNELFFKDPNFTDNRIRFDQWDFIERQCKLVANSSMAWSFFAIETLHPLFDWDLVSYFPNLPISQRLASVHYTETLISHFFGKQGVDFMLRKESLPANDAGVIKQKLIRFLPDFLKKWYYQDVNPIRYREITHELIRLWPGFQFKSPVRPYSYNSYLIQWYLQFIKKTERF